MTLTLNVEFFYRSVNYLYGNFGKMPTEILMTCSMLTAVPSTVASAGI